MKAKYFSLLLLIFFIACSDDDNPVDYISLNDQEIQDYLEDKDLDAEKSKGYYTNGSVFDESPSEGISFNLQQVIKGWTEGITYFKEGGSGMLLIPSHLGYGFRDYRSIPGGSVLIFEIDLIEVVSDSN